MLTNESRMWLVVGGWFAAVVMIVASSVAAGASASSSALIFVLCATPLGVALLIGFGAPPPTVAELLYTTHKEGRR
jgi:hypothetical protein